MSLSDLVLLRLLVALVLHTFVQYLIAFCNQLETASDVISARFVRLTVPDKCVQFCYPHLNCSGEIRPKAIGCSIFGCFSNIDICRQEVAGDVLSGVALESVRMDAYAKFCDSMSNDSRDM